MHNAAAGRDNEHVLEGLGSPLEEHEPLPVPFHLHGLVPGQSLTATKQQFTTQRYKQDGVESIQTGRS